MHRGFLSVLACLSIGCGPAVLPGDGDGAGSAGSDDATSSATTTAVTATTTTTATTFTTSSATIGDDADDDVLDDDGPPWDCGAAPPGTKHHCTAPFCAPTMPDVLAWISVDDGAAPTEPVPEPYVYACTITGSSEDSSVHTFELTCADGPHTLAIATSVGLWFDTTGDFLFTVFYEETGGESSSRLVTLRRADGELVLAGGSSPSPPDAMGVPPGFFDPLVVSLVDGVCPVDRPADDLPGACYSLERQALFFELGSNLAEVFDHGVDALGPYAVLVQFAEQRHEITCSDLAESHYSWIVVPPIPD